MPRAYHPEVGRPRPRQPETAIDPPQHAAAVEKLAVGEDRAEVRLGIEVVLHTADKILGRLTEAAVGLIVDVAGRLVVGGQHTHRQPAGLAGQLRAPHRVDDGSRVYEGHRTREGEDLGALDEEWPKLPEKEWESAIHLDLRPVRLDLREVGVDGEVGGQVRSDAVFDVQSRVGVGVLGYEAPGRIVERPELYGGEGREKLEVAAGREVGHPLHHAHLTHEAGHIT